MRCLVTGSLGTLGRPLVAELRRRGHEVWGCDLRHDADPQFIRADVAEYRQLDRAFGEAFPEIVYHLAAEFGRFNGEDFSEQLWRTAMVGTRNVMDLCEDHGAKLAFASSSEVYGEADAPILDEGLTEREVIVHPNEYALSKWANERQILAYAQRHDLEAMRLRFFNSYGQEAFHPYRSVVAQFCHRALQGQPLTVYRGYHRTFMWIEDFIPTLANVCEAFEPGAVANIGGRDYRSVEELAEIVIAEAGGGEIELVEEDVHNVRSKLPDITYAAENLGHDPQVKLEEGVPLTLEWMRDGGLRHAQEPAA